MRYLIGWYGYSAVAAVALVASIGLMVKFADRALIRRMPITLLVLLALMGLSSIWSNYQLVTTGAFAVQVVTTVIGVFFATQFDWRQLLNIFANTIRAILIVSLIIELVAAVTGPIKPPFAYFEGDTPPSPAYWWVQGNLFQPERIQGFVGNANLIAFVAVLGLAIFFVEYLVSMRSQLLAIVSMFGAAMFIALAKSASMFIALVIVVVAAIVAMFAEGKAKAVRHQIYRGTLWAALFGVFLVAVYWSELTDFLGKTPDASGRFTIWQSVWALILDRWLLGWGWISHWIPGVKPYEGLAVMDNVPYYHAHNAFLDVWLQLGIIGLAVFLWLLWSTFSRLWKIAVSHTNPLYLWPLFVFMVIATQALTESRLLIEGGWVLLTMLSLKSREPFENLEPLGMTPKPKKLLRAIGKLVGK